MSKPYDSLREKLLDRFDYWNDDITDDDVFDFSQYDLGDYVKNNKHLYLYQYRRPDYYSIRNLETQKIHLSKSGTFNDVYEGMPIGRKDDFKTNNTGLYDLAYVSCFSEVSDSQLMWSHYADSHKGFCVQYDLKLLQKDPFKTIKHIFPVMYSPIRLINHNIPEMVDLLGELRNAVKNEDDFFNIDYFDNVLPLLIRKSSCWEYEKEWRIIYTLKHIYDYYDELSEKDYALLKAGTIPFPCVSSVFIGYRIEEEKKNHIVEICNRLSRETGREIPVYKAYLSNNSYDILFDDIKQTE